MILFNGTTLAKQIESQLSEQVESLREQGRVPHIAAILFEEDTGSVLYTQIKREAAERIGINYSVHTFSMLDDLSAVQAKIAELNQDDNVTGIIIQKPWRSRWQEVTNHQQPTTDNFQVWWHSLTSLINERKDVDGLHPNTLEAVKRNTWRKEGRVLPATCKAVLTILDQAFTHFPEKDFRNRPIAILGRSDILGQPLFYELRNRHFDKVELLGSKELRELRDLGVGLTEFAVVVTATGRKNLITGNLLQKNALVVDVGEPQPDVEYQSVSQVAGFLTPVPGGVGPMTIVSLLENAVSLAQ